MKNIALSLTLLLLTPLCMSKNLSQESDTVSAQAPLADVLNFYAMPAKIGTAGQPARDQFTQFRDANYSAIINLAMPDSENALANEDEIVKGLGMAYTHIPVPWNAPSAAHVKQFFETMDALGQSEQNVLVHCAANYRASVFTYKYLTLRKGVTVEQATTPLLEKWLPEMDANWQAIMALTAAELE